MKKLLITILLVLLSSSSTFAGNFILKIDGKEYEIDPGEKTTVDLADGKKIMVELEKKLVADFKTANFSFSYPSHFAPSRTELAQGIYQTMLSTPSGSVVMIQEYSGIDPSGLVDTMLTELLKEEKQCGYNITITQASKTLSDGRPVSGKHAVSASQEDEYERYVLAYGGNNAGILIVTQTEKKAPVQDQTMVGLFWKSLQVTVK